MKLWAQSLNKLGETSDSLERVRPSLEKYAVPLREGFRDQSLPVHAVYALGSHNTDEFEIIPVKGLKKVRLLKANTYRQRYMEGIQRNGGKVVELAQQVRISRVKRPNHGFLLDELLDLLEKDFIKE
jgi:hypothetical protein